MLLDCLRTTRSAASISVCGLTDFWIRLDVVLRLAIMRSCGGIGFQSVNGAVVAQPNSFFTVCAFSPTFVMAIAISVMDLPKCLDQRRAASPSLKSTLLRSSLY